MFSKIQTEGGVFRYQSSGLEGDWCERVRQSSVRNVLDCIEEPHIFINLSSCLPVLCQRNGIVVFFPTHNPLRLNFKIKVKIKGTKEGFILHFSMTDDYFTPQK